MNNANRLRCHRRFMAVKGVRNHIPIVDYFSDAFNSLTIDCDFASLHSVPLQHVSSVQCAKVEIIIITHIVGLWSISKFCGEDIDQFPSPPSGFAISIIGEMIWIYLPEPIFKKVGPRPRITRNYNNIWRRQVNFRLGFEDWLLLNGCKCHGNLWTTTPFKICKYTRWRSQGDDRQTDAREM